MTQPPNPNPDPGLSNKKLTICITGANGLVGKALVQLALKEGHDVLALDIHSTPSCLPFRPIQQDSHDIYPSPKSSPILQCMMDIDQLQDSPDNLSPSENKVDFLPSRTTPYKTQEHHDHSVTCDTCDLPLSRSTIYPSYPSPSNSVDDIYPSPGPKLLQLHWTSPESPRASISVVPGAKWAYKRVDCTDFYSFKRAVQEARCDALVHLAVCANIRDGEGNILDDTPEWQVHNSNVAMSYNALSIAADLGIKRVVLASSVNSIGMLMSKRPKFDYLPLDENHPFYPEDAYSLAKHIAEIQSDAFARRHPRMRIATLRFHAVLPDFLCSPGRFPGGTWKDLWGWVSLSSTAKACLLSLITPEERFPRGHETFFIVASTTQEEVDTVELIEMKYPELIPWVRGGGWKGRQGLFNCEKAKRLLGWEEELDGISPNVCWIESNKLDGNVVSYIGSNSTIQA